MEDIRQNNVRKLFLSLLIVLTTIPIYSQFGYGGYGYGGYGGYGYGRYGRGATGIPRPSIPDEEVAPPTAEEIVEQQLLVIKESVDLDPFETAIVQSTLLEFTKKRIELQILKPSPEELQEAARKIAEDEENRLRQNLSPEKFQEILDLKNPKARKKDKDEKKKKKKKKKRTD